jgi:hypothetical protein
VIRDRWKLVAVMGALVVAIAIGIIVTRSSTSSTSTSIENSGPVSANLVRAGALGDVNGEQALRDKIEPALRTGGAQRASTSVSDAPLCTTQARELQPQGAPLAYVATARWQGTPADVFGFSPPGAPATTGAAGRPHPTRVYVLARSDCRLLVFQSFAP